MDPPISGEIPRLSLSEFMRNTERFGRRHNVLSVQENMRETNKALDCVDALDFCIIYHFMGG